MSKFTKSHFKQVSCTGTISLRLSGKKAKVACKLEGVARNDMDLDRDAEDFDEPLQESTKMSAYIKAL